MSDFYLLLMMQVPCPLVAIDFVWRQLSTRLWHSYPLTQTPLAGAEKHMY